MSAHSHTKQYPDHLLPPQDLGISSPVSYPLLRPFALAGTGQSKDGVPKSTQRCASMPRDPPKADSHSLSVLDTAL